MGHGTGDLTQGGSLRWQIRFDASLLPDILVVARMASLNRAALDYYLFPFADLSTARLRLAQENGLALDGYRFDSLDPLYALASRSNLWKAA